MQFVNFFDFVDCLSWPEIAGLVECGCNADETKTRFSQLLPTHHALHINLTHPFGILSNLPHQHSQY